MSEYFIFDGVDCRDFGVYVFDRDTFSGSGRTYEGLEIPGKSGNVLIDGKRHPNRTNSYSCVIYERCEENLDEFRNFLLSRVGYCRLEDTIHPDEYYQACYMDEFTPVLSPDRKMAKVVVSFDRKPQRYLKTGELTQTYTAAGQIFNPTRFPSQPLIRAYGSGQVGVGSETIIITGIASGSYIDIDCEIMEAYEGTMSRNSNVQFTSNDFPSIEPGINGVTLTSGISRVEITPRWYKM